MVWLPVFGIFHVRTDVDACDCTRGLYGDRNKVCTGSLLWEKCALPRRGLEPASVSTAPGLSVLHSTRSAILPPLNAEEREENIWLNQPLLRICRKQKEKKEENI